MNLTSFHWNHRSPQTPANCQACKQLTVALSWLKWEKRRGAGIQKGTVFFSFLNFVLFFFCFFLLNARGNQYFILIPLQTRTPSPLILDQNYINTKNQVIKAERRVLKELGFCVHVKHPHKVSFFSFFFWVITF